MRMSQHHYYALPTLVLLLATAASREQSTDISKWKVYSNEKAGFQLKYPHDWAVSSGKGTPPEIVYFRPPYHGVIGRALNVIVQHNRNPRKLSIAEWFAEQMRIVDAQKVEAKGCSTVVRRP